MDYPKRLHLLAKDQEGDPLGCPVIKKSIHYREWQKPLPGTRKIERVECIACLRELIKHRLRPKYRDHYRYQETVFVYLDRNHQLEERLTQVLKDYEEYRVRTLEEKKQRVADLEARRQEKFEENYIRVPYSGPPTPFEARTHDYGGEDISLPAGVLEEALHRNHGNVDCDERTLALRMERGRNLEIETSWYISETILWTAKYDKYKRIDEYWDL